MTESSGNVVQDCNLRSDSAIKRRSGTYWAIAGISVSRNASRRFQKGIEAELSCCLVAITITPASLRTMLGPVRSHPQLCLRGASRKNE